jgi:membrane protease subunit HflK
VTDAGTISGKLRRLVTSRWRWPLLVLVLLLADFGATGIWTVDQDETGVVLTFGRYSRTAPPGIHLTLPWPFERMERVVTGQVRTMWVGFRILDKRKGVPPEAKEKQWLTGDTNIVEIQTEVQFVVIDPVKYLFEVADLDGLRREFVLRKAAESVLTSLVAEMKVDGVLSIGKAKLQEEGRRAIQEMVDGFNLGVQVESVNIVQADPPEAVIDAFNDVSQAVADKERMLSEADGYARNLLPGARAEANRISEEAEIYASRVVESARGEAKSFTLLLERVAAAPEVSKRRIWLEELEKALARSRKVVYSSVPGRRFKLTDVEGKDAPRKKK